MNFAMGFSTFAEECRLSLIKTVPPPKVSGYTGYGMNVWNKEHIRN
jgi:hypothetical protein